ncbi:MAG: TrkH family potassium uptake protein [Desulfocapsaceae bacterium]|nr:TrkH family potassium uptake protein [Desulfocapsaceae bacterium]
MKKSSRMLKIHPAVLVLSSFLLLIFLGAFLLRLRISTVDEAISWIDALFTATSAVCVTGLAVVDTSSYFTIFGQWVILGLIQMGGLGVMTVSVALFTWIGRAVSIRHRLVMQDLLTHTPRHDIYRLVKSVIISTLATELAGAILLTIHWCREMPLSRAIYNGIFHSVSAFCNAGFSLFPDSFERYGGSWLLNCTICALIIIGGIGFPVVYDLYSWLLYRKTKRMRLSVQTKSVLLTTVILILGGAVLFAILEYKSPILADKSMSEHILIPLFQSVSCRTAGFNTIDISQLKEVTIMMMIFLMFIGASPGSCGGGVKTTTLALLTVFTISRIRHKKRVNMFKKSIPEATVTRSMSLILIAACIISLVVFMLLFSDSYIHSQGEKNQIHTLQYLFETVSAFGTVGLSMGITSSMSTWDKCWIVLVMIIGRVGILTFSYIIVGAEPVSGKEYSEENMMIG